MPRNPFVQSQFNAGQWSEKLRDRFDLDQYSAAVAEMTNAYPYPHGPFTRRAGTRDVTASGSNAGTRLIEFVFSRDDAFILEFTNLQVRAFKANAVVDTVVTPYTSAQLFDIAWARVGDTLYLAHPDHAPRKIVRFADNDWRIFTVDFAPPPSYEAGIVPSASLTLSATTGNGVIATASASTFLETDVDRLLSEVGDVGVAVITAVASPTSATIDVLTTFSSTSIAAAAWQLEGSPVADVSLTKTSPLGAKTTITALREQADETELVTNGNFSAGATSWTNFSAPTAATGTADAGSGDTALVDAAATFVTSGVEVGYVMTDESTGKTDRIETVTDENNLVLASGGAVINSGNNYTIRQTGTAGFTTGAATLNGGENGIAWIQQAITTVVGRTYRLVFNVTSNPLSLQIGSTSQASDVLSELTYNLGENVVTFVATTTTTYIQFRNNQNANATVDDVSVKLYSAEAFRATDVGKFIVGNEGTVEIIAFVDATQVTGVIRQSFATEDDIVAGAWSLESSAWSAVLGYPRVITLFERRIWYGSTLAFPVDFWFSQTNDYENFARGTADSDGGAFSLATPEANRFEWMLGETNLLIGTEREEVAIGGGSSAITPTNILTSSPSHIGSQRVAPLRVGAAVLFVERGGKAMREFAFDADFTDQLEREPPEITLFADGIADGVIKQVAYQQKPTPTIYAVLEDGTLIRCTYKRDQSIRAWSTVPTTGFVRSVAVIPSGNTEVAYIAVDRNSATRIEYFDESGGYYGPLQVDAGVVYDGVATTTVTGLSHLNGLTVDVLGDGANLGTFVVSGGQVTLPSSVTKYEAGLPFDTVVTLLRPGGNDAPTIGFAANHERITVGFIASIGGRVNGDQVPPRSTEDLMDAGVVPFTGYHYVSGDVGDGDNNIITIEQTDPLPLTVSSVARVVELTDI